MRNNKGQAAMEFLMTYGWAILAAVIVVGVLWYMIGNPANLVSDKFSVSAPLVANAMSVNTTAVQIEIRNGDAESITITSVDVGCGSITPDQLVTAGSLQVFTIDCAQTAGDRMNEDVSISYTKSGSSVTQEASGTISARI